MAFDGFIPALAAALNALFLVAGVYIYVSILRQIGARALEPTEPPVRTFDWPEAFLAGGLATLFLWSSSASSPQSMSNMGNRELIANGIFTLGLLLFIAAFLRLRRLDISLLAGFSKIGFRRAVITGGTLMLAAYPLIFLADIMTQRFLGGGREKQGIVELFNASGTLEQRIMIIVLAVTLAPIAEEFFFRFFFYGVVKRYFGRSVGLAASALLFAAVHAHLPSFAPLFVLGACFTIAYEWSGSILVSMTMHALFNALTLTALAFPELFRQ